MGWAGSSRIFRAARLSFIPGQHDQHDADGFEEIDQKAVDRPGDDVGLPMHLVELDSHRQQREQLLQPPVDGAADIDGVASGRGCYCLYDSDSLDVDPTIHFG